MRSVLRDKYLNTVGRFKKIEKTTHILNLHYVTSQTFKPEHAKIFSDFLNYLSSQAKIITIGQALNNIENKKKNYNEAEIALTFDDGYEECYHIIAPLLEEFGTTGTFFINSNYPESSSNYQQYFKSRINVFNKKPMSWKQIRELASRGHVIGSHTADHYNLNKLSIDDVQQQILEDKQMIQKKLGDSCNMFAWPFGTFNHYSKDIHDIAKEHYDYIFSSANDGYFYTGKCIINRRHIEPFWNKAHINYFLSRKKEYRLNFTEYI